MFSEWKHLQRHQRGVMMESKCRTSYSEQEQESAYLELTKASKLSAPALEGNCSQGTPQGTV